MYADCFPRHSLFSTLNKEGCMGCWVLQQVSGKGWEAVVSFFGFISPWGNFILAHCFTPTKAHSHYVLGAQHLCLVQMTYPFFSFCLLPGFWSTQNNCTGMLKWNFKDHYVWSLTQMTSKTTGSNTLLSYVGRVCSFVSRLSRPK